MDMIVNSPHLELNYFEGSGKVIMKWRVTIALPILSSCLLVPECCAAAATMYFDSWEFTNAPGGISNGITSGFKDESDIDYLLPYRESGADNDWRWGEQWLPHAAWYLIAASTGGDAAHN